VTSQPSQQPDRSVAAFRLHLAAGLFMVSWCANCGTYSAPNAGQCEHCDSAELQWRPGSGIATLVSWAYDNTADADRRQPVVIAQLAEGPWWWGRLVLDREAHLAIGAGLAVEAAVEPDGSIIPVFRLA
jgi:uncharacterized protein